MLPAYYMHFEPDEHKQLKASVSPKKIALLEESKLLSSAEKIHLVLLLIGFQQICDIGVGSHNLSSYEGELHNLDIPFNRVETELKDRWIVAGANEAILEYIDTRWTSLSEIEAGVLYGYPITHVLAFSNLLKSRMREPETAAAFYLGGIYSQEHFDKEKEYFEEVWGNIHAVSPLIVSEAERNYRLIIEGRNKK